MSAGGTFVSGVERLSSLELFVRRYAEQVGGGYEEIEPQVYDLLLESGLVRVSFDPEAMHEHPEAQLAALGSPLMDTLVHEAAGRGATAIAYRQGLNLHPHDLQGRLSRTFRLPSKTSLELSGARAVYFPQCVCWFEFTFESDQREQAIVQVAIDLATGRQIRQLDQLVEKGMLDEIPLEPLAVVQQYSTRRGIEMAAQQAVRTAASLANARRRELHERLKVITDRMNQYYDRMLGELADRAAGDVEATKKLSNRRQAIEQERALRLAEAAGKHELKVSMRPTNLLVVMLPKLTGKASWSTARGVIGELNVVYDPMVDAFEPVNCLSCGKPTFELKVNRLGHGGCPQCQ